MAGTVYETAEGSTIEVGCDGDSLTVNGIKMVLKKDIVTTNGVIHLIDQVLVPDSGKTRCELSPAFFRKYETLFPCDHHRVVCLWFHISQGSDGADGRLPGHFH